MFEDCIEFQDHCTPYVFSSITKRANIHITLWSTSLNAAIWRTKEEKVLTGIWSKILQPLLSGNETMLEIRRKSEHSTNSSDY